MYGQSTVPAGLSNVVAIAAGGSHSLALKSDGTLVAWGSNDNGESTVPTGLTNVVAIAAGISHCVALTDQGTVVTWGYFYGTPRTVPGTNIVAIVAARSHVLVLRNDGVVLTGGDSADGLNYVPEGVSNVIAITTGAGYHVALMADGRLRCWGIYEFTVPGMQNLFSLRSGWCHTLGLSSPEAPFLREPYLLNPSRHGRTFEFEVPTISGKVYQLQWQGILGKGTWRSGPLVAGTGGRIRLVGYSASPYQKFYRVRKY